MLWLIVAALTTTAAADSFQLANGSQVEGTLATYELGGNCQIFVSSGQVRGATLLLPCEEIVAFSRPEAEPMAVAPAAAAPVTAVEAPVVVAAAAPLDPADAVAPDAHLAPPAPVVLVPEVVEAREPVVMSSEPAVQAVAAEQLPGVASQPAPAPAAVVAAPDPAAPPAAVAMAAPHPEPVSASLPEGYTLPAARVAPAAARVVPDAMAEATPPAAAPAAGVAVDEDAVDEDAVDAAAVHDDDPQPENLRGTPRPTERLDGGPSGDIGEQDVVEQDDDEAQDASEEASAEPEGWRAREDRSGGASMPRWLYKAIYGEAPPDRSSQPERDDAGSSGQDT